MSRATSPTPAVADHVFGHANRKFGRVDTLVNNAGIFIAKPFVEYTQEDYQALIGVNLGGLLYGSRRRPWRRCQGRRGPRRPGDDDLVDHATPTCRRGWRHSPRAASRRREVTAIEYASHGVRVNAVSPGIIQTPLHRRSHTSTYAALHPVGRMGEVDDIVAGFLPGACAVRHGRVPARRRRTERLHRPGAGHDPPGPAAAPAPWPRSADGRLDIVVDAGRGQQPVRAAFVDALPPPGAAGHGRPGGRSRTPGRSAYRRRSPCSAPGRCHRPR